VSGRLNGERLRAAGLLVTVVLAAGTAWAAEEPAEAPKDIRLPPIFLPSISFQLNLAKLIEANPEAQRAFQPLRKKADEALKIPPSPLEKIVYEGRPDNDPERIRTLRCLQDMERLYALSFAYRVTHESAYQDQASDYILAWVRRLEPDGNPINDSQAETILLAYRVVGFLGPPQEEEVFRFLGKLVRAEEA
jgi:hypothetical protein